METNKVATNFLLRRLKKLSLEVVLLAVVFFICLWLLFLVTDMVFEDKNTSFDEQVFSLINPYINSRNTRLMQFITFFGSHFFLLPANIILAGIFLFIKKHRWYSLKIAAVSITSTAVMFLLKGLLQRQRPLVPVISNVHGYSFPSGHSFSSLVFFGMLGYIVFRTMKNKWIKWLLMLCCFGAALLVGFSRIYLKLHYTSDVIAGLCLGIIWLLLARWLLVKTEKTVVNV
ncbi:MAG: phosphatase PAP2 family protein [Ferruginibacter sp.]|nr:phosphatase PAP2 family protein [Ferruginibacter sp.]